jgi:hypothetical protein
MFLSSGSQTNDIKLQSVSSASLPQLQSLECVYLIENMSVNTIVREMQCVRECDDENEMRKTSIYFFKLELESQFSVADLEL